MKEERRKNVDIKKWKVGIVFFVLLCFVACVSGTGIEPHHAWVRSALTGETTAVFVILHSHIDSDDALIGITTDVAEAAEMHLSEVNNDVMSMKPQERIEIPAGEEVVFEHGGYHIMLIGLKRDLKVGDEISVTFDFEHYQDVTVNVHVMDAGEMMEHHQP